MTTQNGQRDAGEPTPGATAISVRGLRKVYRLYRKPAYRALDLLGLCPPGERYYGEHTALDGVDLEIPRGQKVAIIGRNGAGKSTLLKAITGNLRPTAGQVLTGGRVSALLQLGAGFHPDFTGRQNVFAGLAHAGIAGRRARALFEEIVDFAEIHEYVDQPMKAYSTGMCARLMFATATVLEPEILVIDELLGVGDAYFAHKSYERTRELCGAHGTTLLMVTHDIYSAMNFCDRFVWIDKGRVRMDGDAKATVAAYEASIKEQEEARLRRVNARAAPSVGGVLIVKVSSVTGFALPQPLEIAGIELNPDGAGAGGSPGAAPAALRFDKPSGDWWLTPESNLGPAERVEGRTVRALRPFGSVHHAAQWRVRWPETGAPRGATLECRYGGEEPADFVVMTESGAPLLSGVVGAGTGWQRVRATPSTPSASRAAGPSAGGHYGSGAARIDAVRFLDAAGGPVFRVARGDPLTVEIEGRRVDPDADRSATVVVALTKAGGTAIAIAEAAELDLGEGPGFVVGVRVDGLPLGAGTWLATVGIAEPRYYERHKGEFFSVSPGWRHLVVRGYEVVVTASAAADKHVFCRLDASFGVMSPVRTGGASAAWSVA